MNVVLGSNDFFGVPFPLVLADRFVHIYPAGNVFKVDVFRWDDVAKTATYEVRASQPIQENIATNPTGIVTFNDQGGAFLFKFRPKPGVSQILGKVPVDQEVNVRITDRNLRVMRGEQVIATLERNAFGGMPIGVQVGADGSVAIGVNRLPAGLDIKRAS